MPSITIDIHSEKLHKSLRNQALLHGRSIEEEIVAILKQEFPLASQAQPAAASEKGLGDAIHELFAGTGGLAELEMLPCEKEAEPPRLR